MSLDLRYRLIDRVRGTDVLGLLKTLRQWQFESHDSLLARERAALVDYLQELRRSIPMFREARCLEDLPVLDKHFINAHRDALMNPFYKGRLIRKKTGGSTGEPLVYFTSAQAQSYLWAGLFLSWEAAGFRLGDRVAILAGTSLYGTGLKQALYYRLLNATTLSAFDMSPQRQRRYLEILESGRFSLLYGYASSIHRLAGYCLEHQKTLRSTLKGVVCTSETLTTAMRRDIETAFGVPCFSQYGCNDAGVSAFECERRDGFHLLNTRSHAEVLSDGRLISTDLANRAMFLPRYDTGDWVRMSGRRCACGRGLPLIDEVMGRKNDLVIDPRGAQVHWQFFMHLFREDSRVRAFQVIFDDRRLTVNLHTADLNEAERSALADPYLERIRASLTFERTEIVFNEPFLEQPNAKHRVVLRRE